MCEIAAHAAPLVIRIPGGSHVARVLVAERDVAVDEIADRLHPRPARFGPSEHVPGNLRQSFGVAIAARQQKNQRLFRQVLYRMLLRRGYDGIRLAGVLDDGDVSNLELANGGNEPGAPVAEAVAIEGYRNGRVGGDVVRDEQIGCARVVDVQHQHHRRWLRTLVDQLVAHFDFHNGSPFYWASGSGTLKRSTPA